MHREATALVLLQPARGGSLQIGQVAHHLLQTAQPFALGRLNHVVHIQLRLKLYARLGERNRHHVDLWIERVRRLFGLYHGLDRHRQFGAHAQTVLVHQPQHVAKRAAHAARIAMHLIQNRLAFRDQVKIAEESLLIDRLEGGAQANQHAPHLQRIAGVKTEDQVGEIHALGGIQRAHHAHVQKLDVAILQVDENVARVRVSVEVTVEEQLLDNRAHKDVGKLDAVQLCLINCLQLGNLYAFNILHCQHTRGRKL